MKKGSPVVAIIMGIIFGLISGMAHFAALPSLTLWTVGGLAVGYVSHKNKEAILNGVLYGFFVSFFFMWAGYTGAASSVSRIPFFAGLGAFGAVCGLILSFIGYFVRTKILKK